MVMAIMSSRLLVQPARRGFAADLRFGAGPVPVLPEADAPDPLEQAFARGFAEGEVQARNTCAGQLAEVELRYAALDRAFADLAVVEEERLRAALRETVAALCEAALQPLALDPAALAMRVERAAAMLRRAADERHIRLHPDDIALVRASISTGLTLEPDASLPRGALRIETTEGGIEDGPECWRAAIREALDLC